MLKEKFSEQEQEQKISEENIEISEQKIVQEIKENPEGFLNWFENLKNSISEWPKSFFENKAIKNAIIYASIPFAVLSAAKQEVKAEDVVSEFINTPTVSQEIKAEEIAKYEIQADDLINIADNQQREIFVKRINKELYAFNKLSDSFNESLLENKNLIPRENLQKIAGNGKVFDFAGRMKYKIEEANQYFEEISSIKDNEISKYKIEEHNKNLFQNGLEIFKILPKAILAQKFSVLAHELGHEKEALEWGATDVKTRFSFIGGVTEYSDKSMKKESRAPVTVAGIKADKAYGEFLVNNLRSEDAPSQLLAIMALAAKSDGMVYALGSNFLTAYKAHEGNDILDYAKETNTSATELAIGLTADFIFDKDNINLLKIAIGEKGVKIPETTIAPFYELGDRGPIAGIKFKGVF